MAILFDDGSLQYLQVESTAIAGVPFSVSACFNPDTTNETNCLWWAGDHSVPDEMFFLDAANAGDGSTVRAASYETGTFTAAATTIAYSANVWQHACGVWAASNDRRVWLNGGNKGTDNTDVTPADLDRMAIGAYRDTTPLYGMSGRIAYVSVWNIALADAEVLSLGTGVHPFRIRPANIVAFWSLRTVVDLKDVIGGFDMTAVNAPQTAEGPLITYPTGPIYVHAGVGGLSIPVAMRHYRNRRIA